jgi:hypothetical protein
MDSGPSTQTGERFAAPQQTRRGRRAERARAHRAKNLAERIEKASRERLVARSEGSPAAFSVQPGWVGSALVAERLTTDLAGPDLGPFSRGGLYADKRAARREIYDAAPELEGARVNRAAPRRGVIRGST